MNKTAILMVMAVSMLGAASVCVGEGDAARTSPRPSICERETLTDDWFGLGETLTDNGVSVALSATQVYQMNLAGGLASRSRPATPSTSRWTARKNSNSCSSDPR